MLDDMLTEGNLLLSFLTQGIICVPEFEIPPGVDFLSSSLPWENAVPLTLAFYKLGRL